MRFVWSSALKDLRRRARDPLALVLSLGMPLVIGLLLSLVFGQSGGTPRGRLLVADEDKTLLSSLIGSAFSQGKLGEMITVEKVDREAGRARLYKGDGSALLVIPKGFSSAVLNSQPSTLSLLTNPAQTILPGIIEESLSILVDAVFYLQSLFGDQLQIFTEGAPSEKDIVDFSVMANRLGQRIEKYLDPLVIKLETKVTAERSFNFAEAFFPTTLFMALLFLAQGLSDDLWKERVGGTLRRLATTPRRLVELLAGKLLAAAAVIVVVNLLVLVAGRWLFGLHVANLLPAALWATFSGTVLFLLMALVQVHASTQRAGHLLTSMVVFPLAMMGGSFFPFEVMPEWLAAIGRWTPNGRAVLEFKAMLAGSTDPARLALAAGSLAALGALAFGLAARRLRRGFLMG